MNIQAMKMMVQSMAIKPCLFLIVLCAGLIAPAIHAQIIPPLGPVFEVDPSIANLQGNDEVVTTAINLQGDYVVVWRNRLPFPDDNKSNIVGRLISGSSGLPIFSTFIISPLVNGIGDGRPEVASALNGSFVVTWSRSAQVGSGIFARQFQVTSNVASPLGAEFMVSNLTTGSGPQVAVDLAGNMVFAWTAQCSVIPFSGTFCAGQYRAYRWNLDEVVPPTFLTPFDFTLPPNSGTQQTITSSPLGIAMAPTNGRFAILWSHDSSSSNTGDPCFNDNFCMRVYDTLNSPVTPGAPLTQRFGAVIAGSRNTLRSIDIAADFTGNFILAAGHSAPPGSGSSENSLRIRRLDSAGEELTPETKVEIIFGGNFNQYDRLKVSAANLNNNIAIVYGRSSHFMKWLPSNFDQEGVLPVPPFQINTATPTFDPFPHVAMALDGNMLVTWWGNGATVNQVPLARRYVPPVEVRINDTSVSEGNPNRATSAFTMQLSKLHPANAPITVNYLTEEGTATATVDYVPVNDNITFGSASLALPLNVQVIDDTDIEDDETYTLRLVSVTNAVITRSTGIGTILNDDTGGVLLAKNAQITEGNSGTQALTFEVTLDEPQGLPVTVSYVTSDLSATAGADYAASFGTLNIPAGFTSAFLSVDVFGDTAFEGDETFRVTLFDSVNATIGPALGNNAGRGTIVSDDLCAAPPSVNLTSASFPVGGGSASINVTDALNCGWTASNTTPWITINSSPNCPIGSPTSCAHGGTGSGDVNYTVAASSELNQRLGDFIVATSTINIEQDGIVCNFSLNPSGANFPASGGAGMVDVIATNPTCPWTAASQNPFVSLTESPNCPLGSTVGCAHGGTGSGQVKYVVEVNENVARLGNINAGQTLFAVNQLGFFFDDFDDGVKSPFWAYGNFGFWTESNSRLIGNVPPPAPELPNAVAVESTIAIARPAFAGCIECVITTKLRFDRFGQGSATIYAWYLDTTTHVALVINEFGNLWELKQIVGGATVATSGPFTKPTLTGVDYTVELAFDGTEIALSIDGDLAVLLPPANGTTPDGTVGYRVEDNTVSFDLIKVVAETDGVALPLDLFANGFE